MAVKNKGKQIAGKSAASASASSASAKKRKSAQGSSRDRSKRRRPGVLQFFDDVAADSDSDEEEEDDVEEEGEREDEDDADFEEEDFDLDFNKGGRSEGKGGKGAGKYQYFPFVVKEEELSGDELEELIKERYGRGSEHVVYDEDTKEFDEGVSLELSAEDPNIWRVKCTVGREQQIVLSLMHKYADLQRLGTKMEILSVFTPEHVKGYVYIETDKEIDVVEACKGFCNMYPASKGLVPRNQIPLLLSTRNKASTVSKGTWVRVKNGKYKGDLGQVMDYDETRKRATIKLVPRIDLQAIAKKYGGGISLKEAVVPAPRLISSQELEPFRSHIEIRRDRHSGEFFEFFDGMMLKDGYLYKKVSIASIVFWGVQPSKDELLKFTEMNKAEEEDVSWLSTVYNVRGKTKSAQPADLKEASEERNGFNIHDLVILGSKEFGVIIDIGKDGIKMLKADKEGQEVKRIKSQDIKSRCVDKLFTASDRHRKTIYINDVLKVSEGPMEGREGTVRHMYKGILFIYDENQEEHSGMFCAKADSCENITPPKDSSYRKAGNKSGSSFSQHSMESCEQEDSSFTFSRNRRSESNQTFSIGQTLRIRKGPLKGYLCRVVGIYRSDVTVKLDSLGKVITVDEQLLSFPNVKREIAADMATDIFGTQERSVGVQSIGTSSWDGGSTSWQALSSSTFSFATNKDQKTDEEQGVDPWLTKVSLPDKEQAADLWGSNASIVAGDQGVADPWGSQSLPVSKGSKADQGGADPWGSKPVPSKEQEQGSDPWGTKVSAGAIDQEQVADPWGSKVSVAVGANEEGADPWGSNLTSGARETEQGVDPWGSNVGVASAGKVGEVNMDNECTDPWGSKVALGGSSNSNKSMDSWVQASSVREGKNSAHNKAAGGTCEIDGDGWNKPSEVAPPTACNISLSDQGVDSWASKLSTNAKEQEQGVDPWDSNVAIASRVNKADPWGNKVAVNDSNQSYKAHGSLLKASSTGEDQNSSWNKGASEGWDKGGDAWKKPTQKNTPVTEGSGGSSGWETAAMGAKTAEESGSAASSWDREKVSSGSLSGWDTADWGKADSSKKNGTDDWTNPKSFGGRAENSWDKPVNCDGGQESSWGKASDWSGGAGSSQDHKNSWNSQKDFGEGNPSGGGRGRGRFGGRGNRDEESQGGFGGGWESGRGRGNKDEDSQGGYGGGWESGRGRGRGRGSYGERGRGRYGGGIGHEDNLDKSSDFRVGWGSGRGRGRGQYGERGNGDEDSHAESGGGWGSGRGRARGWYGGRGNRNEDIQDSSGGSRGSWGSERGRGRGRYGGRGYGDDDSQDRSGDFGGVWGSGRGRGRGRLGGGHGDEDNQDSSGNFGGGWEPGRGAGRGRYGGRYGGRERGTGDEDDQNRSGDFGGWGSGRSRLTEQEKGADPWGSNVGGASGDQEQGADPWGSKVSGGDKDQKQGADPWSSRASSHAADEDERVADLWGKKPAVGATEKEQDDQWGGKPAVARAKDKGADPWGW